MRQHILAALGAACLAAGTVHAQEPLPDDVAQLYLAYQEAEASGDLAVIVEAADRVYRAARSERVDDQTLATLAENLGYYAAVASDHDLAYDAWRYAAERTERFEGEGLASGYRWQNAAVAAYALGDEGDARRCAMNASDGYGAHGPLDDAVAVPALEAHLLAAQLNGLEGRFALAGRSARRALDVMEQHGQTPDRYYALALFHAGVDDFVESRYEEAAVLLHLASDMFEFTEAHAEEIERSNALARFAGYNAVREISSRYASEEHEAAARAFAERRDERIEAYGFHETIRGSLDRREVPVNLPDGATTYRIVFRQEPTYPIDAARRGAEGWTAFRYTVTEEGRVEDIELMSNVGDRSFVRASIDALEGWLYEPAILNGEPIRVEGIETQFNFQMAD